MSARRPEPNIAEIAAVIGDPGRAAMLFALLGGQALPASDLAARASVSPQAATAHFKKLIAAGLLVDETIGRHRFFRLASPDVAHAIEALTAIAKPARIAALPQHEEMQRLRVARSCYDHLAGRLGVAVTDALTERNIVRIREREFDVTRKGIPFFEELQIDLADLRSQRRAFSKVCLDWTERRPHLAGSLGAAVLHHFVEHGWVLRNKRDRSLAITPAGHRELRVVFGVQL